MANIFPAAGDAIKSKCTHENKMTKTINVGATCETTATFCIDCGKQLSKPKTDCR